MNCISKKCDGEPVTRGGTTSTYCPAKKKKMLPGGNGSRLRHGGRHKEASIPHLIEEEETDAYEQGAYNPQDDSLRIIDKGTEEDGDSSREGKHASDNLSGSGTNKTKSSKMKVTRACFLCKKSHAACDNNRPCARYKGIKLSIFHVISFMLLLFFFSPSHQPLAHPSLIDHQELNFLSNNAGVFLWVKAACALMHRPKSEAASHGRLKPQLQPALVI